MNLLKKKKNMNKYNLRWLKARQEKKERLQFIIILIILLAGMTIAGTGTYPY